MESAQNKTWNSSYGYFGMLIIAFVTFAITLDFGSFAICLALGLCFNPFNDKPYTEWTTPQKTLVLGQLALAALCAGVHLYIVVSS